MTAENNYTIEMFISDQEIQKRIAEISLKIQMDFKNKNPLIIAVLKGSFIFCADLIRHLNPLYKVDFITLSSYSGQDSTGKVIVHKDIKTDIAGYDVIIVEDIVDTGLTMDFLKKDLIKRNPKSISVCALLDKKSKRKIPIDIEYVCFEIPDDFVVGFGLDYNGLYRGLPYIGILKES
jgi:hypoxanthine phosphoribosyltransferase